MLLLTEPMAQNCQSEVAKADCKAVISTDAQWNLWPFCSKSYPPNFGEPIELSRGLTAAWRTPGWLPAHTLADDAWIAETELPGWPHWTSPPAGEGS